MTTHRAFLFQALSTKPPSGYHVGMRNSQSCDLQPAPERWLILALVCVGTFMSALDVSIVNVALPTLTATFKTTVSTSQWFVLAYTFVITVFLLMFGRLGDLIGRRPLYGAGLWVFVAGSLLCGFSVSAAMLIIARAFQAIGSSIMMSSGPALATEGFAQRDRGRTMGLLGTSVALGLLTGPIVGGAIVQYVSWRWMFFLNVPVGLVLAGLLMFQVTGFDQGREGKLDLPGAGLMALALAALIIGLTYVDRLGWTSIATVSILASALVLGTAFVIVEKLVSVPILEIGLFADREYTIGAVSGWANYAAITPVNVFIPFYLQNVLGYPPGQVGLVLAAGPITLAVLAPISGSISDRIGSRFLTSSGLLLVALGILLVRMLDTSSAWYDVVWRLVLVSVGSATFVSPNSSAILGSVGCEDLGTASGTIALVRNLGMVCGVALAGAIITTVQRGVLVTGEVASNPVAGHLAFLAGFKAALLASAAIAFAASLMSAMRIRPGDMDAVERMG